MAKEKLRQLPIRQLRSNFKKATKNYVALRNFLEESEEKIALPKIKKKYEGKYFKYRNSSGSDTWWLYSVCREVISINRAICDSFEVTPYECEFKIGDKAGLFLFQIEISKEEYTKAATVFQSAAAKLTK